MHATEADPGKEVEAWEVVVQGGLGRRRPSGRESSGVAAVGV